MLLPGSVAWRVGDRCPGCLEQEGVLKALRGDSGRTMRNEANQT